VLLVKDAGSKKYSAHVSEFERSEAGFFDASGRPLHPVGWLPLPAFPVIPSTTIWDLQGEGGPAEILTNQETADEMCSRWPTRYLPELPPGKLPGRRSGYNRLEIA
jgi:hypothetical protein